MYRLLLVWSLMADSWASDSCDLDKWDLKRSKNQPLAICVQPSVATRKSFQHPQCHRQKNMCLQVFEI